MLHTDSINISKCQVVHSVLSYLNKTVIRDYFEAYGTENIDAVMKFIDSSARFGWSRLLSQEQDRDADDCYDGS
jgi:hypothetical protein